MAIASFLLPTQPLPTSTTPSFLNSLAGSVGDTVDAYGAGKLAKEAAQRANSLAAGQQPVQTPGPAVAAAPVNGTAPVMPVDRGAPQGSTYQPFIDTVQKAGITNPNALAAIAATGRAESGYSPQSAAGSWSDPSQSGQAGQAGGIMSWRGPRLASLQSYAASKGEQGNGSPQTQAEFLVQENPQLTQQLQNAKSPQEAAGLMANAWQFAGYNKQGGEAARRQALTQNYYANQFASQQPPQGQQAASAAPDPSRFASGPVAQGMPGLQTAMSAQGDTTQPAAPYVDPQVVTQQPSVGNAPAPVSAPAQTPVTQQQQPQGPQVLAAGVTPLSRQNLDPDLIRRLVQNPITRATGLAIAQQALGGNKPVDGWDFVKLDDGTLARANKQTGQVETLGNFLSAKHNIVSDGKNGLYDADAQKWITPPNGAQGAGNEFFGTTIPYRDANGVLHYRQLGKNGQGQDVQLPDGAVAAPPVKTVDTGTGTEMVGPGGVSVGNIAKDVTGKAVQEETGKATAAAAVALPSVVNNAQNALDTINTLQGDPELPNMVGPLNHLIPNVVSHDRTRVQGLIDQLHGQQFLSAYDQLRKAGAITDIEGKKGTDAMTSLSEAQSFDDYNKNLEKLKGVISRGVDRARQMATGNFNAPALNGVNNDLAVQNADAGALSAAKDAIAKGAPRDAVVKRLTDAGIDASGL